MTDEHVDEIVEQILSIADEYIDPEKSYTLLYVVGDPPTYEDRVPDDWSDAAGTTIGAVGEHGLVRFHPREIEIEGFDRLTLTDGTLGMYPEYDEYDATIAHHIEPTEYALAVYVHHHPVPEDDVEDRFHEVVEGNWNVESADVEVEDE